jgi:hypothetical protein
LVREAALADSVSAERSHFERLRVLPGRCLPADSFWPGHIPAHEARWRWVGKRSMSAPISASRDSAVRRLTPGIVQSSSRFLEKGAIGSSTRWGQRLDRLVEEVDVGEALAGRGGP